MCWVCTKKTQRSSRESVNLLRSVTNFMGDIFLNTKIYYIFKVFYVLYSNQLYMARSTDYFLIKCNQWDRANKRTCLNLLFSLLQGHRKIFRQVLVKSRSIRTIPNNFPKPFLTFRKPGITPDLVHIVFVIE